jgi:hypothetical protein
VFRLSRIPVISDGSLNSTIPDRICHYFLTYRVLGLFWAFGKRFLDSPSCHFRRSELSCLLSSGRVVLWHSPPRYFIDSYKISSKHFWYFKYFYKYFNYWFVFYINMTCHKQLFIDIFNYFKDVFILDCFISF